MTDGNTYLINKYLDEREDYDALQEVTAELDQAEADNIMLIERLEELSNCVALLEAKLTNQTHMITQVFALLDVTEETEDGRVFHPNQIRSSRVLDAEKLDALLAELRDPLTANDKSP